MRRVLLTITLYSVLAMTAHSQSALTVGQRVADLEQLSSFYAKNYAPYEWKRGVFGFDLLNLTPWQSGVHKPSTNDLDYQELLIEYVASLNDAHDYIAFPTLFQASLPFSVDIFEGKVLVDAVYGFLPFSVGDELVSVDGKAVQSLIESFRKYSISANPRTTDRVASTRIVSRNQQIMPHIYELGDTAVVEIRSASTGAKTSYTLPWSKIGIPLTSQGPLPSPRPGNPLLRPEEIEKFTSITAGSDNASLFRHGGEQGVRDDTLPSYMQPVLPLLNASVSPDYYSVLNMGNRTPIYRNGLIPFNFVQRRGSGFADFTFSGTYVADGVRIGLIRIPSFSPSSSAAALTEIEGEINYFNANTDALIVDVMRNPGGSISFAESVAQRFIPFQFRTMGFEIRATAAWLYSFGYTLTLAKLQNAPAQIIANLQNVYAEVLKAFNQNRGRSAPVSLNSTGSLTLAPASVNYSKPLMVLTDEFSASCGDMFPAMLQDNHRGPIFGMRTMGAGGSVVGFNATAYTESFFRITVSLMNRGHLIETSEYPAAPYIENIGVRPDRVVDYMTRSNLVNGGRDYVQAFTSAVIELYHNLQ